MTQAFNYRWPSKLRKFGIDNPFLMLLVAKYENEIPWERIRDSDSLTKYVADEMLSKTMQFFEYPATPGTKNIYLSTDDIDINAMVANEHGLFEPAMLERVSRIRKHNGEQVAKEHLVDFFNEQKSVGFKSWLKLLKTKSRKDPAFAILILRPLIKQFRGNRRTIAEPNKHIVDWLFQQIKCGKFNPNDDLSSVYNQMLVSNLGIRVRDGWVYISSDIRNASRLTGISRGSGWCVASNYYAKFYLNDDNHFFILRDGNRPVVALRVSGGIEEYVGRYNQSVTGWWADLDLFVRSNELGGLPYETREFLDNNTNYSDKSEIWWKDRIRLWPFAAAMAPENVRNELSSEIQELAIQYLNFPNFDSLAGSINLEMTAELWSKAISKDPGLFLDCPDQFKNDPSVVNACVLGWCDRLKVDRVTLGVFDLIPEFVRTNQEFQSILKKCGIIKQLVRNRPKTRSDRESSFDISTIQTLDSSSPADLISDYILGWLRGNQDGEYSKSNLFAGVRDRKDLDSLYENAWRQIILLEPPFYLATPNELRHVLQDAKDIDPNHLIDWCNKVEFKPWILTQKSKVPKSIRCHPIIVQAYRNGWLPYLKRYPNRLWVKRGRSRVYMSYALLNDKIVIDALVSGWQAKRRPGDYWYQASERMRDIPAIQVSILRAIDTGDKLGLRKFQNYQWNISRDIKNSLRRRQEAGLTSCYETEISNLSNRFYR
jgi:hypothetical protein